MAFISVRFETGAGAVLDVAEAVDLAEPFWLALLPVREAVLTSISVVGVFPLMHAPPIEKLIVN